MSLIMLAPTPKGLRGECISEFRVDYETVTSDTYHHLDVNYVYAWFDPNPSYVENAHVEFTIQYGGTTLVDTTIQLSFSSGAIKYGINKRLSTRLTHSTQSKRLVVTIRKVTYGSGGTTGGSSGSATISIPTKTSYQVTYNKHAGSDSCTGIPSAQTKWHGEPLTLSSSKPTRKNYMFVRWNTSVFNDGTAYNPGATYSNNAALGLYAIWNAYITYDANGGTGAPPTQIKQYDKTLTLQSQKPTRSGYTFLRWNTKKDGTGMAYLAGSNYNFDIATTLYAEWKKVHSAPTIPSMTCVRWQNNKADDSGTQCKVDIRWSIDTSVVSSAQLRSITGTISPSVNGSSTFSFNVTQTSSSAGTATAIISGCDTDTQYLITATVTDNQKNSNNVYYSTSKSDILTRASFVLDFKAGGKAIGIGSAAPSSGLEIGWPTQFDKPVTTLDGVTIGTSQDPKSLTVTGTIIAPQLTVRTVTSDLATAYDGWTISSQTATIYGRIISIMITAKPTNTIAIDMTGAALNNSYHVCTIQSDYVPSDIQGFANKHGFGEITSGGYVSFTPAHTIGTSSTVYIAVTYILRKNV